MVLCDIELKIIFYTLKQGTCVKNKRECLNNHEIFSHRYFFDSKFYDRGSVWISNKEK